MAAALTILEHEIEETQRHLAALILIRDQLTGSREAAATSRVDLLRQACIDLAIPVGFNDSVSEEDAARLLHRSRFTLRNRRLADEPIPFMRSGNRVMYRLCDLAKFLDQED
ncbi:hypothetical protein [Sinorhizobium psoraleae]|uniref:Helix-turn-helix protein n=1 Tax=Sinorhizobium psoraleae TaxID=520838 RepID=A0ABT4KK29_9HYPH|nr:hypothetical protein [Sinorhizobium psoraleae]MCZ4091681.1 hypothetical protein [Sinorhizobium psoraleae]